MPSKAYLSFSQNSLAATSSASAKSVPSLKPADLIASAIRSSAARLLGSSGAKPPSSPTPVARPFFFSTALSAW